MRRYIPRDVNPIWLEDDMEQVTLLKTSHELANSSVAYGDLPDGTQLSDCPLPCTTTFVETRLISETESLTNYSTLDLTFSQTMTITTTGFVRFNLAKVKLQWLT